MYVNIKQYHHHHLCTYQVSTFFPSFTVNHFLFAVRFLLFLLYSTKKHFQSNLWTNHLFTLLQIQISESFICQKSRFHRKTEQVSFLHILFRFFVVANIQFLFILYIYFLFPINIQIVSDSVRELHCEQRSPRNVIEQRVSRIEIISE